jgi:hypothetical protein
MTRRFWTPEESARLGYLWTNTEITAAQIAIALKRTARAVFHQVGKLGLPSRLRFWTPDEDERLRKGDGQQLFPDDPPLQMGMQHVGASS